MDSINMALFLEKTAEGNPEVNRLMGIAVQKFKERQELKRQCLDSKITLYKLQMDVHSLGRLLEKFKENEAIRISNLEMARKALLSTIQTRLKFEKLDLQKLNQFELLKVQMNMKDELEEAKRHAQEKRNMYEEMNNREIVQQLRKKQKELSTMKDEMKSSSYVYEVQETELKKQLQDATNQRNSSVIEFVKRLKDLHQVQEELTTGELLPTNNLFTLDAKNEEQMSLKPLDSLNALKDFKKMQFEMSQFPYLFTEFIQNSSKNQNVEKNIEPIKSILRNNKTKNEEGTGNPKRVFFVSEAAVAGNSCSSNDSDDDVVHENPTMSLKFKSQMIAKANQESETVIEDDEKYNDEQIHPAQKATSTIDLLTLTPEINENDTDNDLIEIKSGEEMQELEAIEFENLSLNETLIERPTTSAKAKENAKIINAKLNDDIEAETIVIASSEKFNDNLFDFESDLTDSELNISNQQFFANFINFSTNLGGDDQGNETNFSPDNDSFSKFFD